MDFIWSYHGAKGVPESEVEDGALDILAHPLDLEESASHHKRCLLQTKHTLSHIVRLNEKCKKITPASS